MAVANTNRIITHGDGQDIASAITSVSKAINDKDKNVLVTGDQTIQGLKSFETKPTFGGSEALNKTDLANGIAEAKGTLITKEQQDKCYQALKTVTKDFTRTDPVYVRVGEDGEPEIHYTMTKADGMNYFANMNLENVTVYLHNTKIVTDWRLAFAGIKTSTAFVIDDMSGATSSFMLTALAHNSTGIYRFVPKGITFTFVLSTTALKHDAILEVFNNLGTVDKTAGITLTLESEKLALMSDAEKAIATEKGWTLA